MNSRKIFGLVLLGTAALGVILSTAGLVGVWRLRPMLNNTVSEGLALAASIINTTQDGLNLVDRLVAGISDEVTGLEDTTRAVALTISGVDPILTSLADLTNKNFPAAVSSAQASLQSAQNSARLIDDILAALTSIPLSPVAAYKPEVPLNQALGQVSSSLDTVTPSLTSIYQGLVDGQKNLSTVKDELFTIADNTRGIGDSLNGAGALVDQYQQALDLLEEKVRSTQKTANGWINAFTWVLTIVLLWLMIAQVGLAAQGYEYLRPKIKETKEIIEEKNDSHH